jgi:hypothetical protein
MILKFLHINLQLAVGTLGDIFEAVYKMQVELAFIDFFRTILVNNGL